MEDSFVFLAEYKLIETGSADLCGVMNHKNKLHGDSPERCHRKSAERYNNKCISSTVKHGGRAVIVWRAFLDAAIGELLHCEK